jgi:hypothetical protein
VERFAKLRSRVLEKFETDRSARAAASQRACSFRTPERFHGSLVLEPDLDAAILRPPELRRVGRGRHVAAESFDDARA